jgi:hypothetical protein
MWIVEAIEHDYMKSQLLEMILCAEISGKPFGVVDLDVTDYDPKEVKARSTDGTLYVLGKNTKLVSDEEQLSLVQRTFLSYIVTILETLISISGDVGAFTSYTESISAARPFVDRFCRLAIDGPAYRMTAMSVCA